MTQGTLTLIRTRLLPAVAIVAAALTTAGCDTLQSDFSYLMEEIIPPTPSEAARMMVDEFDVERRRKGMTLIANSPFGGGEQYVAMYRLRVELETNPIAKAAAIRALARHGGPEHAPLIARQLTDPAQQVRWEAAKGLQRLHNPDVVTPMLEAFRNPSEDRDVRAALCSALAQYPEDRVFQALLGPSALDATELLVNINAETSLRTLTGQGIGDDRDDWLGWYNRASDPFAEKQEFYYSTYSRSRTWFEYVFFWTRKTWETPQQPAGLRPDDRRRTYPDDDEDDALRGGGAG